MTGSIKLFSSSRRTYRLLLLGLFLCALAVAVVSLGAGQYRIAPADCARILLSKITGQESALPAVAQSVVLRLRLPRTLTAALVGAALAASGAVYQGVFANPLVSPDLLGVSSGACVGAASAILLGLSGGMLQAAAFAGGILAVALTFALPRLMRSSSNLLLVLSGIIVGGLMSSALGLLKYLADPRTQLAEITYWQMGSFSGSSFADLAAVLPAMGLALAVLFGLSWWMDVLSMGEDEARAVGANVGRLRGLSILCATVLTACAICLSGTIGWVGLVLPHVSRRIAGGQHRRLLPVSLLIGASFMILADIAARTLTPLELPISILTGAIGAPFYAWILLKRRIRA